MEESQEEGVLTGNFEENPSFEGEYADVDKLTKLCDGIKLSLRSISRNIIFKHRLRQVVDAFRSEENRYSTGEEASQRSEAAPLLPSRGQSYSTPDHPSVVEAYDAFLREIDKTESFYLLHHTEIEQRYKALLKAHRQAPSSKQQDFEAEFVELYRQCFFLREFSLVNFSKLLSLINSHFRVANTFVNHASERMTVALECHLYQKEFSKGKATRNLSKQICKTFADFYCKGSIPVANMRLLAKQHEDIQFNSCRVGFWAGMALLSATWLCFDMLMYSERPDLHDSGGARVFRLLRCALIMYLGMCCQVDADLWPSNSTLFLALGRLATFYFLMHLAFVKGSQKQLRLLHPTVAAYMAIIIAVVSMVVGVYVVWTLIPRSNEQKFLARLKSFFKSIFLVVIGQNNRAFFTAYITDYLTSSSKILQDATLLICDLSSPQRVNRMLTSSEVCADRLKLVIPLVMIIPISMRMIQNVVRLYLTGRHWPFLPNALKYALAHTIVIYSTLYPSFLLSPFGVSAIFLLSTVTFIWDVKVDWGLGHAKYKLLRKRLMLRNSSLYYFAMVLDFIMRYFWTLTLIPKYNTSAAWLLVVTAFSTELELIRRGFWGVLRVENEHLNNTRGYRNVKYTPLYFDRPPPPKKQNGTRVSFAIMLEIASITAATFALAIAAIVWYE